MGWQWCLNSMLKLTCSLVSHDFFLLIIWSLYVVAMTFEEHDFYWDSDLICLKIQCIIYTLFSIYTWLCFVLFIYTVITMIIQKLTELWICVLKAFVTVIFFTWCISCNVIFLVAKLFFPWIFHDKIKFVW